MNVTIERLLGIYADPQNPIAAVVVYIAKPGHESPGLSDEASEVRYFGPAGYSVGRDRVSHHRGRAARLDEARRAVTLGNQRTSSTPTPRLCSRRRTGKLVTMARQESAKAPDDGFELVADNRKARHDFFIEESLECGLALTGTEVKSLRAHKVNLRDSYARIKNGEAFLYGVHIGAYAPAGQFSHKEIRPRKLLMHRREIDRWWGHAREQGYTMVPLKIYFRRGRAKVELGLAKGKKLYDKREAIKRKTARREVERELRHRNR